MPVPARSAQGPAHCALPPIAKLAVPRDLDRCRGDVRGGRRRRAVAHHLGGLDRFAFERDRGARFAADRPAFAAVGARHHRQQRVGATGQVVGRPSFRRARQRVGLVLFVAPAGRRLAQKQAVDGQGVWIGEQRRLPHRRLVEDLFFVADHVLVLLPFGHRDDRSHPTAFANRRQRHRVADRTPGGRLPSRGGAFALEDRRFTPDHANRGPTIRQPRHTLGDGFADRGIRLAVHPPARAVVGDHAADVHEPAFPVDRELPGRQRFAAGKSDRGEVRFFGNAGGQGFLHPTAPVAKQQPLLADDVAATGPRGSKAIPVKLARTSVGGLAGS